MLYEGVREEVDDGGFNKISWRKIAHFNTYFYFCFSKYWIYDSHWFIHRFNQSSNVWFGHNNYTVKNIVGVTQIRYFQTLTRIYMWKHDFWPPSRCPKPVKMSRRNHGSNRSSRRRVDRHERDPLSTPPQPSLSDRNSRVSASLLLASSPSSSQLEALAFSWSSEECRSTRDFFLLLPHSPEFGLLMLLSLVFTDILASAAKLWVGGRLVLSEWGFLRCDPRRWSFLVLIPPIGVRLGAKAWFLESIRSRFFTNAVWLSIAGFGMVGDQGFWFDALFVDLRSGIWFDA